MPRGEASLGPLAISWEVPDALPEASGGLEHLASRGGSIPARWTIRDGAPGPAPTRSDAFYGPVLLELGERDHVRVWGPGAELIVRAGQVDGVVNGPVALAASIALHALAAYAGLAHVHAALVRIDGKNVLAPAGSGSGKTSFALALATCGGELLTDDVAYVGRDLVAWAIPRPPHVTAETLAAHPGLAVLGPVVEGVLSKVRVDVARAAPAAPVRVDAIVLPSLDPGGATRITPIEGVEAFPLILGSSALAVVEGTPRRDEILDVLAALAERPAARLIAGRDALDDPRILAAEVRRWLTTLA